MLQKSNPHDTRRFEFAIFIELPTNKSSKNTVHRVSLLRRPRAQNLSWGVKTDTGFVRDRAAVLKDIIKGCICCHEFYELFSHIHTNFFCCKHTSLHTMTISHWNTSYNFLCT
jgi:hypothetical protein